MNAMTYLPDTPSELLTVALDDLKKVERSTRYIVDMDFWHEPTKINHAQKCIVCLAGAAIAKTLNRDATQNISPGNMEKAVPNLCGDTVADSDKIWALDKLRTVHIKRALYALGYTADLPFENRVITPYNEDRKQFKRDLRKLARDLMDLGY